MRNRVALLACLVALSPSLALAVGTITITESSSSSSAGGLSDEVINIAECEGTVSDTITLTWRYGSTLSSNEHYRLYAQTSSTCPENLSPTGAVTLLSGSNSLRTSGATGEWTTPINVRAALVEPLSLTNSCTSGGATIYFCVVVAAGESPSATVNKELGAVGSIVINVSRPAAPTSVSTQSGDGALTVRWVAGSGGASVDTWRVEATPVAPDATHTNCSAGGAAGEGSCSGSSATECRVTGLTNDACYDVTVQAFSAVNNPSEVSAAAAGIPRPVDDFWETYQRAGGVEEGGCSGGPASALALLVLATAAPRLRRRRP